MTDFRVYRDGSEEYKWLWEAHYKDGTILKQRENGVFHKFHEIQQDKLSSFWMVAENHTPVVLQWRDGLKLIHFHRVTHLNIGASNEFIYRLYCFGYEEGSTKTILTILPDDSVVISNNVEKMVK